MSAQRQRQIVLGLIILILAFAIYHLARAVDPYYYQQNTDAFWTAFGQHIRLTLITIAISLLIAVPIGTLLARLPILYTPVMAIVGIIYTVPSLALLVVLAQYIGIGLEPAIIALVAYAQFILVRNVVVGLRGVDPTVIDAARGMGMNGWQILFKIEYPLALPVILGGVRVATVATIAIATIAALIDAGGLGQLLFDGINENSNSEIEVGAIAVSSLAVAADVILRLIDRSLPATRARTASR
jgi:osmoprotectant transport system permease protein